MTARPTTIWLALAALTGLSVLLAERGHWGSLAIPAIFAIAAIKGELILRHYMDVGHAAPHWRIAYRLWLAAVTAMLIIGHLIGRQDAPGRNRLQKNKRLFC